MPSLGAETRDWIERNIGAKPDDARLWLAAFTHGSTGESLDYQRLEFLGDRVLGLTIAQWLYEQNGDAEGTLSQRLNALVSRRTCAQVARRVGLPAHIRLGKQANADGGRESDNILGDVTESVIGACFVAQGFDTASAMVRRWWQDAMHGHEGRSKHPKSALQEWAAGNQRKPPEYEVTDRSGPDHAARFTVRVKVHKVGEAEGVAGSKGEAEKAAAKAFMERYS